MYAKSGTTSNAPLMSNQQYSNPPVQATAYNYAQPQTQHYNAKTVYVDKGGVERKRYIGCGSCCACCCAIFLILFFFIPRPPRAYFESTYVTFNPYTVTQTYSVRNSNMYSLTLSNFDMKVSTDLDGYDLIGYGILKNDNGTAVVPALSKRDIQLYYIFNATSTQISNSYLECFSSDGVTYKTTGTVDMKTWSANFHSVDLGPYYSTYICST